jgi:uncharacterized protein YggU (UPF0235/DUF167 family)
MYVRVVVYPGAKRETVSKVKEGYFEVSVKEPAERNLANKRIKEILGAEFSINPKAIQIVSGHHSSRKIFSLPDEITDKK